MRFYDYKVIMKRSPIPGGAVQVQGMQRLEIGICDTGVQQRLAELKANIQPLIAPTVLLDRHASPDVARMVLLVATIGLG